MLARLRERRRHPPAAAAGPAASEASERRAERGARCAEGAPRDARLSLDTVALRRCRVHLCVYRGGGRRAIGRVGAHRFDAAVVSNRALPSSPSQRMRAAGSRPPPFRRRRCLDLLLLLLYLSEVAGASPASAFAAAVAARARPCGKFVALAELAAGR